MDRIINQLKLATQKKDVFSIQMLLTQLVNHYNLSIEQITSKIKGNKI